MKLLVLSDLHEDEVALERLELHKTSKARDVDYVLIAGDSSNTSTSFITELLELFPEAYIIPGNCENQNVMEIMRKAKHFAHEKRFPLKDGYNLVGFGYSNPTPFGTPNELSDDEIYRRMNKLKIDQRTMLLVHAPPYGILDEIKGMHIGSKAIRKIIEERQPFLVFCGHLHEVIGVERFGNTLIVSVPPGENWKYSSIKIEENSVCVQFEDI